jgi:hypothetical protein
MTIKLGNLEYTPKAPGLDLAAAWDLVARWTVSPTATAAAAIYLTFDHPTARLPKVSLAEAKYDVVQFGQLCFARLIRANVPVAEILAAGAAAGAVITGALFGEQEVEEATGFLGDPPSPEEP